MFDKLQKRWKVRGWQLLLIILTFAIGGSLTGYVGKKLMTLLHVHPNWLWVLIYIVLIVLIWPLAVIVISIPFGQYPFFLKYVRKIGRDLGLVGQGSRLAIFASGAGSNAKKIIEFFKDHPKVKVALIVSNNPQAGVITIAKQNNIPVLLIEKERFFRGDAYIKELNENQIDFIVLAGFLWKLPSVLIKAFPHKIVNIHPALLPKYGGKGMYGHLVHEAVIAAGDKESGITIHYVDELYDHGNIIAQFKCPVLENDTADTLAQRIHALEHEHYPRVIEEVVSHQAVGEDFSNC